MTAFVDDTQTDTAEWHKQNSGTTTTGDTTTGRTAESQPAGESRSGRSPDDLLRCRRGAPAA